MRRETDFSDCMRQRSDPHDHPTHRDPRKQKPRPAPALAELRRETCWIWVDCARLGCWHRAPMTLVPLIIRWSGDTSSDRLRCCARCTKCNNKGAGLMHPSRDISLRDFATSPVDEGRA
jgi:hypothetical protein